MSRENNSDTVNLERGAKASWQTWAGLAVFVFAAGAAWADLHFQLSGMRRDITERVTVDELESFSLKAQILNPNWKGPDVKNDVARRHTAFDQNERTE